MEVQNKPKSKCSAYQRINDIIVGMLESNNVPWLDHQRLNTRKFLSYATGKEYSLLNCLLLETPGYYVTFSNIQKQKGHILKGSKSKVISTWVPIEKKVEAKDEEDPENDQNTLQQAPKKKEIEKWRFIYYRVFNLEDTMGLESRPLPDDIEFKANLSMDSVEDVLCRYLAKQKVKLKFAGKNDSLSSLHNYSYCGDQITMLPLCYYKNPDLYYRDLLHEVIASTGQIGRLARETAVRGGQRSEKYADVCEDLVCEMGSAYLCAALGVNTDKVFQYSAEKIETWLDQIKSHSFLFIQACEAAEKAARYVLEQSQQIF